MKMSLAYIAIFASGSGSNAQSIIEYFQAHSNVKVALLLSNNPEAKALSRAADLGVPTQVFSKTQFQETDEILCILNENRITHIVLAGFLLQIPPRLIKTFPNKIVNIHPSLLPKFGGKGMYGLKVHEAVKAANEKETGITIHEVNEHYDEGRIIFQASCEVLATDSAEQIAQKVQRLEHQHFPVVIEQWIQSMN
jgi:phosphoribosylglycinamide formyltransferase-1